MGEFEAMRMLSANLNLLRSPFEICSPLLLQAQNHRFQFLRRCRRAHDGGEAIGFETRAAHQRAVNVLHAQ